MARPEGWGRKRLYRHILAECRVNCLGEAKALGSTRGAGGPARAASRDPRALPPPLGKEKAYAFTLGSAWPWRKGNCPQERQDMEGFMQPLLESSVGSDHLF